MAFKYLKQIILQKFRIYCKHCTLHGFCYYSKKQQLWVYVTWSIIIASSLTLCAFLSHMIWQKFIIDPTFTVVETTRYSTTNIPFPAVTVCDSECIYGPSTDNITDILKRRSYNSGQIDKFYMSITEIRKRDYSPDSVVKKMHAILHDLGYTLDILKELLRKPCDVLLTRCAWRSRAYNCSQMFRDVYTHLGYCCQFDMAYFRENANEDTTFVSGVDATEALDVIVNGKQLSPSGDATDGHVLLFVYDDKNRITLEDNSIHVTPAGFFDVNVYVWIIDSSKDVQTLSVESRKCLLPSDPFVGPQFYQGCLSRLILRKVVSYCRCLPFKYTSAELDVDDYSPCTWERMKCIYETIESVRGSVRDLVAQNQCLQRCDYVQYDTEIEYLRQQRSNGDTSNDSLSRVTVHFTSTTCIKYRREVLYTWDQLLANLGGIFGLCLGGSIISIVELLWFLIDLLFTVLKTLTKNKSNPYKNNKRQDVFTLSQMDLISQGVKKKNDKGNETRYRYVN